MQVKATVPDPGFSQLWIVTPADWSYYARLNILLQYVCFVVLQLFCSTIAPSLLHSQQSFFEVSELCNTNLQHTLRKIKITHATHSISIPSNQEIKSVLTRKFLNQTCTDLTVDHIPALQKHAAAQAAQCHRQLLHVHRGRPTQYVPEYSAVPSPFAKMRSLDQPKPRLVPHSAAGILPATCETHVY